MATLADPAKKRRAYGSGSISQRADGLWVASIEAGWTQAGTRRRIRIAGKTKREVQRKLRDKQRQIATDGLPSPGVNARTTVKSWGETWLEHNTAEHRPKTVADRSSVVRKWINPLIGQKRLDTLTPGDIRGVGTAITKAGLSSSTANNAHRVLLKLLRDAVHEGHTVPANALTVKAPATAAPTRKAIPTHEVRALIKTARGLPDCVRWQCALILGLRQGEALGLTWEMVDLDRGLLDIAWQLQELPYIAGRKGQLKVPLGYEYRPLEGRYALTRPKTKRATRIVPLVDDMLPRLKAWKATVPANPHGLVWPADTGRPRDRHQDGDTWRALQDMAAVHKGTGYYVLHEARHSAATMLLEYGADPETVKAILGHTNIETSRGYQHASMDLVRGALEGVSRRLQLD